MPRQADFAVWVAGGEQAAEFGAAAFAEAFVGGDQQAARPIEGVVFAAPVAEGVVLDSGAHLVDAVVGEADDVERVGNSRLCHAPSVRYRVMCPHKASSPRTSPHRPRLADVSGICVNGTRVPANA